MMTTNLKMTLIMMMMMNINIITMIMIVMTMITIAILMIVPPPPAAKKRKPAFPGNSPSLPPEVSHHYHCHLYYRHYNRYHCYHNHCCYHCGIKVVVSSSPLPSPPNNPRLRRPSPTPDLPPLATGGNARPAGGTSLPKTKNYIPRSGPSPAPAPGDIITELKMQVTKYDHVYRRQF